MKLKKNKKLVITLIIVLIILILINVIIQITSKDTKVISKEEMIEKQETETRISKLSQEDETERIKYYLSTFIGKIENKNWNKAYEMLYDDFKSNYFSTENSFQEYCELYFPNMMDVQVDNIERINNIYVIETTINDLINGTKTTGKIGIYFVIRENKLDDFDLSFSVNSAIDVKNN